MNTTDLSSHDITKIDASALRRHFSALRDWDATSEAGTPSSEIRAWFLTLEPTPIAIGIEGEWHSLFLPTTAISYHVSFDDFATDPFFPGVFQPISGGDLLELDSSVIRFRHLTDAALSTAVSILQRAGDAQPIDTLVQEFIDLFTSTPPTREVLVGLWGELALIHASRDVDFLVSSWVDTANDFASVEGARIEVKTTSSGSSRIHSFRQNQADPELFPIGVIASVITESLEHGTSIADLLEAIKSRASPSVVEDLERTFWRRVGNSPSEHLDDGFDLDLAVSSLKFLAFEGLPRPHFSPHREAVREASWSVDVSNVPAIDEDHAFWGTPLGVAFGQMESGESDAE